MGNTNRRRLPWVLVAIGAALALCALAMLLTTRGALQYCVSAPKAETAADTVKGLAASAKKLGQAYREDLAWTTVGGVADGVSLSGDAGTAEVSLVAMGEGWLEVYPRFVVEGTRVSETELAHGDRVIMLDVDLAFRLFGNELPPNASVKLADKPYRVIGTVRHAGTPWGGRGVGDACEYDAYVPLLAAVSDSVPLDVLTLSALPASGSGAAQQFEEAARAEWLAGGTMINLPKEVMRRAILPRLILLVVGLYALVGLFRRMTRLCAGWFAGYRRALNERYFNALIPRLLGIIALTLLGYGALIGVTYLLMAFSVQPLYVFTEWVPDNIVSWSSLSKVFWNLTTSAARLTRIGTRELRTVEFWGAMLRWGIITTLLGFALRLKKGAGSRE